MQIMLFFSLQITLVFISALHGSKCRLAMRKMSVRLSNVCIVIKRKKDLSRFLYHTKDHLA